MPGGAFHPDGSGHNTIRLSFSLSDEAQIEVGIFKLCGLIGQQPMTRAVNALLTHGRMSTSQRESDLAMTPPKQQVNPLHLLAAFGSGGLLTMMVFLNGEAGRHGGALFSSWLAHGTGTVAAILLLALLWRRHARHSQPQPPRRRSGPISAASPARPRSC